MILINAKAYMSNIEVYAALTYDTANPYNTRVKYKYA